jgi:hypothetical protein
VTKTQLENPESLHRRAEKGRGLADREPSGIVKRHACREIVSSVTLRSLEGGASRDENWLLIVTDDVSAVVAPWKVLHRQGPLRCNQSAEKSGPRHSRGTASAQGKTKTARKLWWSLQLDAMAGHDETLNPRGGGEGCNCAASGQ